MREKGKFRKEKKILIRVNEQEKKTAEEMAQSEGKNTSEFFRDLLDEHRQKKFMDVHMTIVEKYENLLEKYRQLLAECRRK